MTFDDLNEACDDMEISGDTPFRLFCDGVEFEIGALTKEPDGSVTLTLEEA